MNSILLIENSTNLFIYVFIHLFKYEDVNSLSTEWFATENINAYIETVNAWTYRLNITSYK